MVKRCIYCNIELEENSVVDICQTCMYKVWGPKMSQAIISSMEKEKKKGNMELGRVSELKSRENNLEIKEPQEFPLIKQFHVEDASHLF